MTQKNPRPRNPLELDLLARVNAYLDVSREKATTFARDACRDPNVFYEIENGGRRLEPETFDKIESYLKKQWDALAEAVKENRPQ